MNYNNTILNSILDESYIDLSKNTSLYEDIYKFYNDKNLLTNEIDLLIIDIKNKLTNKKTYIKSMYTFSISIALSFVTSAITTNVTDAINKKNTTLMGIPSILGTFLGVSISFFILSLIFFIPFIKSYRIDEREKLIYIVMLKALNYLKAKA
jgi:hypothetical protein